MMPTWFWDYWDLWNSLWLGLMWMFLNIAIWAELAPLRKGK